MPVDLPFDPSHPVAATSQQKLKVINDVNASSQMTYQPAQLGYTTLLCPVHNRLFHPNWQHGRIYIVTARGGAALSREERQTIRINGEPTIELDYSAMHPRIAYHLRGLKSPDQPYHLWSQTNDDQKELAKLVVNASLNAKSRRDAIGACCEAIRLKTRKNGEWKQGNKLRRARQLRMALAAIGIYPGSPNFFREARKYFVQIYDRGLEYHAPIACDFLTGFGRELMRVESEIALDVMYHFAAKGIPILGIHDSFVVPASYAGELHQVMHDDYQQRLGFAPVIK
jgi:hypothetical protein